MQPSGPTGCACYASCVLSECSASNSFSTVARKYYPTLPKGTPGSPYGCSGCSDPSFPRQLWIRLGLTCSSFDMCSWGRCLPLKPLAFFQLVVLARCLAHRPVSGNPALGPSVTAIVWTAPVPVGMVQSFHLLEGLVGVLGI